MTCVTVSPSTPLTHSDHAIEVFVVLDCEDYPAGVYTSLDRAMQYIKDWQDEAAEDLDEAVDTHPPQQVDEYTWRSGTKADPATYFKIIRTDFRI